MSYRSLKNGIPARWSSYEEYVEWVRPQYVHHQGPWEGTLTDCLFENLFSAGEHFQNLREASMKLSTAFRNAHSNRELRLDSVDELYGHLVGVTCEAEYLLLYLPSLATDPGAGDFLAEKDLDEHWHSYVAQGNGRKLFYQLDRFVKATDKLVKAFYNLQEKGHSFLHEELRELPEELLSDFKISRDLFSVHINEAGAFFAGRGLECVLRMIAQNLRINVEVKGNTTPLHEMDFADIAEALRRVRWKKSGSPVMDRELKSLIDLLRTARNAVGHPKQKGQKSSLKANWREVALLAASAAADAWRESSGGRRKVVPIVLPRDW